ncbi:hypothetical protein IV203_037622 [Nitzschia inconspicua]|uniref:RNI-like protein n=1 Tax=Nitzschia inconspicua TaxID=303405 RepID=A0A9K3PYX7_9STRA|nr:hypothetical protein IV203_037622 [Nitzschia inconspicua]
MTHRILRKKIETWFDVQSTVESKSRAARRRRGTRNSGEVTVIQPLNSIDIIDGDDYYEIEDIENRLKSSMREPHVEQLVLSELQLEPPVIHALVDLLRTRDAGDSWQAVFLEFCRGDLEGAIRAVLSLNNVRKLEIAAGIGQRTALRALATNPVTNNETLQELSLFSIIDEEVVGWLTRCFTNNSRLTTLRLIKCTFTESAHHALATFLVSTESIQILTVDRCVMNRSDGDLARCIDALVRHPALKELSIGGTLCDESRIALSKLLTRNKLTRLCLQNRNAIATSSAGTLRDDIQWIAAPIATNTSLKILDLSQRCLNDESLLALSEALRLGTSRLEELRLHENQIGNDGIEALASCIPTFTTTLRRIFLHRNRFDETGAEALLKAIRQSFSIRELTIPSMGRSSLMTKYQRLISYETMLNCGGKHLLKDTVRNCKDKQLPPSLWPLVFERSGRHHWTPYSEDQMTGADKWRRTQQADLTFYLLRGLAGSILSSETTSV